MIVRIDQKAAPFAAGMIPFNVRDDTTVTGATLLRLIPINGLTFPSDFDIMQVRALSARGVARSRGLSRTDDACRLIIFKETRFTGGEISASRFGVSPNFS